MGTPFNDRVGVIGFVDLRVFEEGRCCYTTNGETLVSVPVYAEYFNGAEGADGSDLDQWFNQNPKFHNTLIFSNGDYSSADVIKNATGDSTIMNSGDVKYFKMISI